MSSRLVSPFVTHPVIATLSVFLEYGPCLGLRAHRFTEGDG
jgi:hypothetical protein